MNIAAPAMPNTPTFALQATSATGGLRDPSVEEPSTAENDSGQQSPNASADRVSLTGLSEQEQQQVRELADRDREVRAHEQAHASVGGRYASAPSYSYERGPNGRQYAVAGEVSIDVSPVPNDPQATIDKARIVRRAALAPAQPSSQDRAVAAEARALEQQARAELLAASEESANRPGTQGEGEPPAVYSPIDVLV